MAIEKPMNSRVLLKNDIEANWMKAVNFIPKLGEAIIYNAELDGQEPVFDGQAVRPPIKYQRIKIGDGVTNVNDLPFITDKLHELVGDIPVSEQIAAAIQDEIYVQEEEPLEAPDGSLWVDLDEEIEDTSIEVDASLSIEGAAADAKAVGDRLASIEEELDKPQITIDATLSRAGAAADAKAVGDALATKQPLGNYVKAVNGNTPDENGNVVVEFEGVTSWNDLTDKPFQYETVYYEWNEDTEYETSVDAASANSFASKFVKISDDAPDSSFFLGKPYLGYGIVNGEKVTFDLILSEQYLAPVIDGVYMLGDTALVVTKDSATHNGITLTKGIWSASEYLETSPFKSLWWKIYDQAVQLDESVIPDTIARVEDIPSTFYVTVVYNPDTNEATSDKAFDEINEAYLSGTTVFVKHKTYNEEHGAALVLPLTNYQEDFIDFNCIIEGNKVYTVSFSPTEGVHASVNEISSGGGSEFNGDADTLDGKHASEFALATETQELRELVGDAPVSEQISEVMPVKWYIQDDEPEDAPEGSLWLDTDAIGAISPVLTDEEINQIVNKEMEAIVNDSY